MPAPEQKFTKIVNGLLAERNHLLAEGNANAGMAIDDFITNTPAESKVRLYDILFACETKAEALAALDPATAPEFCLDIAIEIKWSWVSNAWIGAVEGPYSPWLGEIDWDHEDMASETLYRTHETKGEIWYAEDSYWRQGGRMTVKHDDPDTDDDGNFSKTTTIGRPEIEAGLILMAKNSPKHFGDLINENDDAITHDVFAQYVLLGDIIYG